MQYKRILMSCLIVILILCTSMVSIGAAEESTPSNVFELAVEVESSTEVQNKGFVFQPGDSFTVSISINNNPSIVLTQLEFEYDTAALTYVKSECGEIFSANVLEVEHKEGELKVYNKDFFDNNNYDKNGKVVTFTFKVKEGFHGTAAFKTVKTLFMNLKSETPKATVKANTEAVYIHDYAEEWTEVTAATCTEKGLERLSCTSEGCEHYVEREIDDLGHDYAEEWTEDTAPTCTTPGEKSNHCTRCEDRANVTEVAALNHSFGEWTTVTEATCTAKGSEKRVCATCGEEEVQDIEAKGHTSVNFEEVEPTKEAVGYTGGTKCSVCGVTLTERTEIPMLKDYTWVYILVAAVVVVAIGGGVCAYVFIFKKKASAGEAADEVSVSKAFADDNKDDSSAK